MADARLLVDGEFGEPTGAGRLADGRHGLAGEVGAGVAVVCEGGRAAGGLVVIEEDDRGSVERDGRLVGGGRPGSGADQGEMGRSR